MDARRVLLFGAGVVLVVTKPIIRLDMSFEGQWARGFADLKRVIHNERMTETERYRIIKTWFVKGKNEEIQQKRIDNKLNLF